MGKSGRLRKQPPVDQGRDEIANRLALYQHLVINQVVARRQADHLNVEYAALTYGLEQRRARRMIDEELMGPSRHIRLHSRCAADDDDAIV